ncbi:MAG: hypothetical protein H0W02_15690 [Ktedonobacteraceae bacterium]|nr:hypothetical protein [Ktedonobacteraceae bacterium]
MLRVLEVVFRHPIDLLVLIVVLPVLGLAVGYLLPRSYQTTASLWALRRYTVIGATGPETNLLATPSATQATALTELLQSRDFALTVARESNLASTLDANVQADPQLRDVTMFNDISQHVQVAAQGYNLYVLSYTQRNPKIAQQVVAAVIRNYGLQSQSFSVVEGHRLLDSYQTQQAKAQHDVDSAVAAEASYIAAHSKLSRIDLLSDPQYSLLHAQTQQAQTTLANIQTKIDTLNQDLNSQGTTADSLFKVLDAPLVAAKPVSRTKELLIAGGVGLGVALLACIVYVLILVRRNHGVYTPLDLRKVTDFPVVMQLPRVSRPSVPLLVAPTHQETLAVTDGVTGY